MPQTHSLVAILASNDLDASEAFYARLGFRRVDAGGDDDPQGAEYRILRDPYGATLHLNRAVEGWLIPGRNPLALYYSRPDVDELAARLGDEVIEPEGPSDKPWGMYEFAVGDPDSTLLRIGWPSRLRAGGASLPGVSNRSMPAAAVVPVLAYADVGQAAAWLCHAFDFSVRLRIADHRIQLNVGAGGAVVLAQGQPASPPAPGDSVMVRVDDVDAHHARAVSHGARVLQAPQDYPYGERQYVAADPSGRTWTFSQSIADVPPDAWGGEAVTL